MRTHISRQTRRASNRARRARRRSAAAPRQPRRNPATLIDEWADLEWKIRWQQKARDKEAMTWKTPWQKDTLKLYSDQPKHQATALFLLRTEVIGLNAWLASIRVPGISPECECGWRAQTVKHVLTMCPLCSNARAELAQRLGSEVDINIIKARECAGNCKVVCPTRHLATIQYGKGNRRGEGGGRRTCPHFDSLKKRRKAIRSGGSTGLKRKHKHTERNRLPIREAHGG